MGLNPAIADGLAKSGPLVAVLLTTLSVWFLGLNQSAGVSIVADIPAGLPPLTLPGFDLALIQQLLPAALLISLVGFLESVSVAKSLASKRRQKIDANQELIALGAANIGASLTGGYPVTGGFSRSLVNFAAGAVTPLASIITAVLIALDSPAFHTAALLPAQSHAGSHHRRSRCQSDRSENLPRGLGLQQGRWPHRLRQHSWQF